MINRFRAGFLISKKGVGGFYSDLELSCMVREKTRAVGGYTAKRERRKGEGPTIISFVLISKQ